MLKDKNGGDASEQEVSRRFRKIQVTALISFVFALVAIVITADGRANIEAFAAHASGKPVRSVVLLLLLFGIKKPDYYRTAGITVYCQRYVVFSGQCSNSQLSWPRSDVDCPVHSRSMVRGRRD